MKRPVSRAKLKAAGRAVLKAGLQAVNPARLMRTSLRVEDGVIHAGRAVIRAAKRVYVVAVGKASLSMMGAARAVLGERISAAIVVSPQPARRMKGTELWVAGHPVPDARGVLAGRRVMELLEQAERGDLVLLLLSGGASALLPTPKRGVRLRDKQRITSMLLRRGATIREMNAVRKQISLLKGGGFARIAAPARVVALALSDVPGDDPRVIGSGPACEDPEARALARRTMARLFEPGEVPPSIAAALRGNRTPSPWKAARARTYVIGGGATFAEAAERKARELGFDARILIDGLSGEARVCGPRLIREFEHVRGRGATCLIATGETVVRVRGSGIGGRNQEVALSAAPRLSTSPFPCILMALGTDGRDGPSKAAGGIVDDTTSAKAALRSLSIRDCLDRNDSTNALKVLGGLLVTGPTGTNVADITLVMG